MKRPAILIVAMMFLSLSAASQDNSATSRVVSAVRAYRMAHEPQIIGEFVKLLSIPNTASDAANIQRNATLIQAMLEARGFRVKLLPTAQGRGPVVFGELDAPGAKHTILFYAHYDGQPVEPTGWTGTKPFVPALRTASIDGGGKLIPFPAGPDSYKDDWRIYARASGDDKAPIIGVTAAVDALRANHIPMAVNLKVVFEGEEEDSSPHLEATVDAHKNLFTGDVLITADGPIDQSGRPLIFFGNRGVISVRITVFGPLHPLHSGHYGNWAPNPAMTLVRLLTSMKDDSGRVTISGWYDGVEPLGDAERKAIADAPAYDDELKAQLGLARTEGNGKSLMELINQPSLNINGISSGDVGALARNVIPTTASAVLDLRLVKGNDYRKQVQHLIDHIRKQGFYAIDHDPTDAERKQYGLIAKVTARAGGYNAERTRMDLPISIAVIAAVQATSKDPIVKLPTSGGSLPLSIITDRLQTVTIT
ncbi:MAG: M20/M25/M40 family metallo-hydrolase, partial [Candidatus Acidiferrales bacterium]